MPLGQKFIQRVPAADIAPLERTRHDEALRRRQPLSEHRIDRQTFHSRKYFTQSLRCQCIITHGIIDSMGEYGELRSMCIDPREQRRCPKHKIPSVPQIFPRSEILLRRFPIRFFLEILNMKYPLPFGRHRLFTHADIAVIRVWPCRIDTDGHECIRMLLRGGECQIDRPREFLRILNSMIGCERRDHRLRIPSRHDESDVDDSRSGIARERLDDELLIRDIRELPLRQTGILLPRRHKDIRQRHCAE